MKGWMIFILGMCVGALWGWIVDGVFMDMMVMGQRFR